MSDAVRVLDEDGFPIQEGNPFPVDAGSSSVLTKEINKINDSEPLFSQLLESKLNDIIVELKKTNLHLSMMTDVYLRNSEVEV